MKIWIVYIWAPVSFISVSMLVHLFVPGFTSAVFSAWVPYTCSALIGRVDDHHLRHWYGRAVFVVTCGPGYTRPWGSLLVLLWDHQIYYGEGRGWTLHWAACLPCSCPLRTAQWVSSPSLPAHRTLLYLIWVQFNIFPSQRFKHSQVNWEIASLKLSKWWDFCPLLAPWR